MHASTKYLFAIGLLLEIAAFLGGQADNIPYVSEIISPSYIEAIEGLKVLDKEMILYPKDHGFKQISKIFLEKAAEENPPEKLVKIVVLKIQRKGARLGFSERHAKEEIPIVFELSNGQKLEWQLEHLIESVNKIKADRTFKVASVIFILGVVLQIIGFVSDLRQNKKARLTGSGVENMSENVLKCPECGGLLVVTDDPIVLKMQSLSPGEKSLGEDTQKNLISGQTYGDTSASSTTVSDTSPIILKGLSLSGQSGPDYFVFKCENCGEKFQVAIEG